jgi:hypothetical protein
MLTAASGTTAASLKAAASTHLPQRRGRIYQYRSQGSRLLCLAAQTKKPVGQRFPPADLFPSLKP